jgi:hypothetical protein
MIPGYHFPKRRYRRLWKVPEFSLIGGRNDRSADLFHRGDQRTYAVRNEHEDDRDDNSDGRVKTSQRSGRRRGDLVDIIFRLRDVS